MSTSGSPIKALIQRLYPMAQQSYRKWEQMPQAEKDRIINDIKQRVGAVTQTAHERFKQSSTTPPTPPKSTDEDDKQ